MMRICLSIVLALALAQSAAAQMSITITKGYEDKTNIAIVPFLWEGEGTAPSEMSEIVIANLERTGQFDALSQSDMRSWPTRRESMVFREWRLLDQDFVVIGRVTGLSNDRVEVAYEVYDPYREVRILGETLSGSRNQWRELAHRASDAIYEEITGVRGVFATKIAYVTVQGEYQNRDNRLMISDADGMNAQSWYQSSQPLMSPAWSPNARRLAFVNFANDGSSLIRELDLDTRSVRTLVERQGSINSAPAFSPDGRRLAFTSSRDGSANIYVMDLSTNRIQQVTRHWAIDTEPNWIDNSSLLFTSGRSGRPQIYRIELGSDNAERVTFEGIYNARPRSSDNGDRVTMVHNAGSGYNIATYDIPNRIFQVLTGNQQDEAPSIAPNGTMVIYATTQRGTSRLAWVSIDGMVENVMPNRSGNVREPAWSPFTD